MVEGNDAGQVKKLSQDLAAVVKEAASKAA